MPEQTAVRKHVEQVNPGRAVISHGLGTTALTVTVWAEKTNEATAPRWLKIVDENRLHVDLTAAPDIGPFTVVILG